MSVSLALIGVGRWGKRYLQTLQQLSGEVRLTYLVTSQAENAQLVNHPVELLSHWRELRNAKGIDGVIIATPPATHVPILDLCLELGLPAMVEKPLCLDVTEALGIQRRAEAAGVPILVDHTQLFQPAFEEICRNFPDPACVRFIHAEGQAFGPFVGNAADPLWDWGAHDVAVSISLMRGLPQKVRCLGTMPRGATAASAQMLAIELTFAQGAVAWLTIGHLSTQKRRRLSVFGEKEILVFDDLVEPKLSRFPLSWAQGPEEAVSNAMSGTWVSIDPEMPLSRAVREFAAGIQGQPSKRFGLGIAVDVVRVLEAAQRSANEGAREVNL